MKRLKIAAAVAALAIAPVMMSASQASAATSHSCSMSYYDSWSRSYDSVTGYWFATPGSILGTMKVYAMFYRSGEFSGRINYGNPYAVVGGRAPILDYEGSYQYVATVWGIPTSVTFKTQRQDKSTNTWSWQSCIAR